MLEKKVYYFLKIITLFAFSGQKDFSIKEVARRTGISIKVLEQVLLALKNKGILGSKRGPGGGYRLIKDVSNMSIMDVLSLTGKEIRILPALAEPGRNIIDNVMVDILGAVEGELKELLSRKLIKDLVAGMKARATENGLTYII
ncbi:MAG: Rrf2 family transcriptional regulator [Candidatus Omnitrophica bacterium]|nr:Rrf2 family transcriptional regulator [Candidatus Omnitrophota bacterium]MDD5488044.1 Rrf2 family transcriptional regulator [Candidatus Omnitrophota bacterium]